MGNTCLHYAVVAKDKDRVKLLLTPKYKSGKGPGPILNMVYTSRQFYKGVLKFVNDTFLDYNDKITHQNYFITRFFRISNLGTLFYPPLRGHF